MPDSKIFAAAYREKIEDDIRKNNVDEALQILLDFVKELAPAYRNDVVALCRRATAYNNNFIKGVAEDTEINSIVALILKIAYEAEQVSIIPSKSLITNASEINNPSPSTHREEQAKSQSVAQLEVQQIPEGWISPDPSLPAEEQQRRYWFRYSKLKDPMDYEVVRFADVSKSFKKNSFKIENLSFALRIGEITGIAGKNGSGKTTLLSLIRRHLAQDAGSIELPSLMSKGESLRRACERIYYIRQDLRPWSGTLKSNLYLHAAAMRVHGQANKNLIDEIAFRYGLSRYYDAKYSTLSGGYRLRYELVKALISQPRLLVLDEPLASLDLISRQKFLSNLRSIAYSLSDPMSVVLTTQNLYDLDAIADQTIILEDGKLVHSSNILTASDANNSKMFEIISKAPISTLSAALDSLQMQIVSTSIDCFIVKSLSDLSHSRDAILIYESLGDQIVGVRDITQSARRYFL